MLLLAVALSLVVGMSLGLLGGGGSILTLPMLVYVLHVEPRAAIASSLFVVGATSAVAVVSHARNGAVRWRVGGLFAAAAMGGAFVGGAIARHVPAGVLLLAFAALMMVTALAMMRGRATATGTLAPARVLVVATGVGVVSGLLGAGGGFLVVPALILFGGLVMREAIATSLLVITLQSVAGFVGQPASGHLDWMLLGAVSTAATVGSLLGARLSRRVPANVLRRAFAWIVLVMGVIMIARQLPTRSLMNLDTSSIVPALLGGALIGLAASIYLFTHGRVAGISGIYAAVFRREVGDRRERIAFVIGLVAVGLVARSLAPGMFDHPRVPAVAVAAAGLLVGYGTQLGNGCTSGHGVCGISRMSSRSLVATVVFIATGIATVALVRALGGAT